MDSGRKKSRNRIGTHFFYCIFGSNTILLYCRPLTNQYSKYWRGYARRNISIFDIGFLYSYIQQPYNRIRAPYTPPYTPYTPRTPLTPYTPRTPYTPPLTPYSNTYLITLFLRYLLIIGRKGYFRGNISRYIIQRPALLVTRLKAIYNQLQANSLGYKEIPIYYKDQPYNLLIVIVNIRRTRNQYY